MNNHINTQIQNIITMVDLFYKSCELAAKQDDGIKSKEETKQIEKIKKVNERYKKELAKIAEM